MKKFFIINISVFCLIIFLLATGFSKKQNQIAAAPGEFIVKLDSKKYSRMSMSSAQARGNALMKTYLNTFNVEQVEPFKTDSNLLLVKIENPERVRDAIAILNSAEDFEFAEPNYYYELLSTPNDESFDKTWGLLNVGQVVNNKVGKEGVDIGVTALWEKGIVGKKDILVAVLDTGIDYDHPDLKENIYSNPIETGPDAKVGVDDDNNGFIDDFRGWNFVNNTNNAQDGHSHGTHCSGTIGAVGNNSVGVPGVNWQVSMLPIKIFSDSGGFAGLNQVVEAINYATKMKAHVMSNSWGGGSYSKALEESIANANAAGIVFIAAAGNNAYDNDKLAFYPAGYDLPNVISVAAILSNDEIASFSNYGKKSVHVAAPGVNTYSTVPVSKGSYGFKSGTSMATPHVAGIAALILSEHTLLSPEKMKDLLIKTSVQTELLKDKSVSGGRVNVGKAFEQLSAL